MTVTDRPTLEALAREAGLVMTPERLDILAADLASAQAMIAAMHDVKTDIVPVSFTADWPEDDQDAAR